jgi:hypothetical protein
MEELTALGLIYVIAGAVLALLLPITLILTLFGIILVAMGKSSTKKTHMPYPMFQPCGKCGRNIGPSVQECPYCQAPIVA